MTTIWTVYVHRDACGRALYVGCTKNLDRRTGDHVARAHWWDQVAKVEAVARFPVKADALAYECLLIMRLDPAHNIIGKPTPVPTEIRERFAFVLPRMEAKALRRERQLLSRALPSRGGTQAGAA